MSEETHSGPKTLEEFVYEYIVDSNTWWVTSSGQAQEWLDDLLELIERAPTNKSVAAQLDSLRDTITRARSDSARQIRERMVSCVAGWSPDHALYDLYKDIYGISEEEIAEERKMRKGFPDGHVM